MHSSRMLTVRSRSHVYPSMHWAAGVCPGGVCRGRGGGVCPGGVCLGGVSQHALRQTPHPLWTEFLTHACENITLTQLRCGRKNYFVDIKITVSWTLLFFSFMFCDFYGLFSIYLCITEEVSVIFV